MKDKIEIYINGKDCVPRLSLANLTKLMAMCRAVDQVPMTVQDQVKILAGIDGPEVRANLDKLSDALDKVNQDRFPNLDHHGHIFYMRRKGQNIDDFGLFKAPGTFFTDSIQLFDNMVADHMQPYYEEAFAKVKLKTDGMK